MIKNIFFDMNNVIENFEGYENGLEIISEKIISSFNNKNNNIREKIIELKNKLKIFFGPSPFEHHYIFWDELFNILVGKPPSGDELNLIYNRYLDYYLKNIKLYEDVNKCLKKLFEQKYDLGIIANGNSIRIRSFLYNYDLLNYFKVVTASGDFYFKKPEKKIFEYSLSRMNSSPLNAVMVGDRLDNDIYGANITGMWSIHLNRRLSQNKKPKNNFFVPDDTIENLNELPNSWVLKNKFQVNSAVIMAGGKGTRMGTITKNKQKCAIEINSKPLIENTLDILKNIGIEKIYILGNYRSEDIELIISNPKYSSICKLIKVDADSTLQAFKFIYDKIPNNFLYCHGDIIISQGDLSMLIKKYIKLLNFDKIAGILAIVPKSANLTHALIKKYKSDRIKILSAKHYKREEFNKRLKKEYSGFSLGLGIFNKTLLDLSVFSSSQEFMVEALLQGPSNDGLVWGYELQDFWFHIETRNDIKKLESKFSFKEGD